MNTSSSLISEMRNKEYRDAYVASQIRMTLPLLVRTLRRNVAWTQPQLAEAAGMAQPRISELEKPGERRLTIETLLKLASAFDVALQVRFLPFSELIDWNEEIDLDNFAIPPFSQEIEAAERANALALHLSKKPAARAAAGVGSAHSAAEGSTGHGRYGSVSMMRSESTVSGQQDHTTGGQNAALGHLAIKGYRVL